MTLSTYKKPGLVPGFFLLAALGACNGSDAEAPSAGQPARLTIAGQLEDRRITEASGIAFSRRDTGLMWLHNDSGAKARLYAIDLQGKSRGRIKLEKANNKDWEDAAAFTRDGQPMLVIADIGDNESKRKKLRLYVIAEPDLADDHNPELKPASIIEFRYPEGPRDAEAIAVDAAKQQVLVLTKRDLPPRLYAVSLVAESENVVDARLLGTVDTLPRPSRRDIEFAPKIDDWHWQPTSMDIAPDGQALVILTYGAVYLYERASGEDWISALRRAPLAFRLDRIRNAEAIAFGPDGRSLYLTVEKKHAPLFRIELLGAK